MKNKLRRRGRPPIAESRAGDPTVLVRSLVRNLRPYVPGEQPSVKGLVKLNTNENPYPPSPKVLAAVKAAVDGRLRLYPNPTAQPLREALAEFHGCSPDNVIVGNGSDELLALAVRAFVDPLTNASRVRLEMGTAFTPLRLGLSRHTVQYFAPSYSLYPVLADIHGANKNPIRLNPDFTLPSAGELKRNREYDRKAALTLVTTPNAPSGCGYATAELEAICLVNRGVVLLDEAYADFAAENALGLALRHPHVLVARTFSKAYSLCHQRVGYLVGHVALIGALQKIRDSYNVNGLAQVAAVATLQDIGYYRDNLRRIIATRAGLTESLSQLGFQVLPSQTNFVLVKPPQYSAGAWLEKLREQKVLVRWWDEPSVRDYLRITVGTDAEAKALLRAVRSVLKISA